MAVAAIVYESISQVDLVGGASMPKNISRMRTLSEVVRIDNIYQGMHRTQ